MILLWMLACSGDTDSVDKPADGIEVVAAFPTDGAAAVSPWVRPWLEVAPGVDHDAVEAAVYLADVGVTGTWEGDRLALTADAVLASGASVDWGLSGGWSATFETLDLQGAVGAPGLEAAVEAVRGGLVARDSDGYAVPADTGSFRAGLQAVIAGDLDLEVPGYALQTVEDGGAWFVWLRRTADDGGAQVWIALDPARDLIVETPHVGYETHTAAEGARLLREVGARALIMNGTHRCANLEDSPCSGTTSVCGATGPYRISDAAHHDGAFFQAAHEVLADAWPGAVAVSVHGFGWSSGEPVAYVSDGTEVLDGGSLSVVFRDALDQALSSGRAASCNAAADSGVARLCGTTNTQGRYSNRSADACTVSASGPTGRFLHLEQSLALRDAPAPVVQALRAVSPAVARSLRSPAARSF